MKNTNEEHIHNIKRFSILTSLLSILNSNRDDDTYVALSRYFLEHLDKLDTLSIFDVAEECFVSRSSIQRFVKDIGFESFSAMKQYAEETRIHQRAFLTYAGDPEFGSHISSSMNQMMQDVSRLAETGELRELAQSIHESKNVVILIADNSSSAVKLFQDGMVAMGKLIRLLTNSTADNSLLESLKKEDLLITISVTGNYALAIHEGIRQITASRFLVTMNHSELFRSGYDRIFYLSEEPFICDRISHGMQNTYTHYGANYFFDLLYHEYVIRYRK